VHALSAQHRRPAAWQRTTCGSPSSKPPADIITTWGAAVTPANVHQEYPRPQMTRDQATTAVIANGLWEFQLGNGHTGPNKEGIFDDAVPFGVTLNQTILVPFPLEACLSGAFAWPLYSKFLWYRLLFDAPFPAAAGGATLLHFGAVDWNTTVYLNGAIAGKHLGGYDAFSIDVTAMLKPSGNELILAVFDPSDDGYQVNGKQRISAIPNPGGDTYTPSSGIWQTVWMESVPAALHVSSLNVRGSMENLHLTVNTMPLNVPGRVNGTIWFAGAAVTTFSGDTQVELVVPVPNPQLWSPASPNLYELTLTVTEPSTGNSDSVGSYFGMREVSLVNFTSPPQPPTGPRIGMDNSGGDMPGMPVNVGSDYNLCWALCNTTAGCAAWSYGVPNCGGDGSQAVCWLKAAVESWSSNQCRVAGDMGTPGGLALRPAINGEFTFLTGFLDQSWWSDGEYAAPSDDALKVDLQIVKDLGMNMIRLHQKVNPQRWYYWADTLGVAILHDMVQKYGGASSQTVEPFLTEFKAMVDGVGNHPCIVQWEVFNEGDCWNVFNVPEVVSWIQAYDPHRLVDTNSGGGANDLHIADVNDIHSYPWPGTPSPSATQYAMVGEFGGIGTYQTGKSEWANGQCGTYLHVDTPQIYADTYSQMIGNLTNYKIAPGVSVCVYTQTTDVENECDGMLNMDRTPKFDAEQTAQIKAANVALIAAVSQRR
jgi:hypothetical protein